MTRIPTTPPDLVDAETLARWNEARAGGIGASEAAAALGFPEAWSDPLKLWAEKTGELDRSQPLDDATRERLYWGHRMEPVLLSELRQRLPFSTSLGDADAPKLTADKVAECGALGTIYASPDLPWLRSTPDAFARATETFDLEGDDGEGFRVGEGELGLVEIKTSSAYVADQWEGGPPEHYLCQVWQSLAVFELPWALVVVLVGGNDFRVYGVRRLDEDAETGLMDRLGEFWGYVESGERPPQPEKGDPGWAKRLEALKLLHPSDNAQPVVMPKETSKLLKRRETLKQQIKDREAEITEIEGRVREELGDHAVGVTLDGKFTATLATVSVKGRTQTVEPYSYRNLRLVQSS